MDYKQTDRHAVKTAIRKSFGPEQDLPERLKVLLRRIAETEQRPDIGNG